MRSILLAAVVLLSSILVSLQAVAADPGPVKKPAAETVRGYSSPREAFNAMRAATGRRDWRTVFFSFTPARQDAEVFSLFDGCTFCEEGNARVREAMKKYGLSADNVVAEYDKYRQKHGVDLDKLAAEAEKHEKQRVEKYLKAHPEIAQRKSDAATFVPYEPGEAPAASQLPARDEELWETAVLRLVTDKAGFYEDASEAITPKVKDILEPDYGALDGLTVSDDTAKGWVAVTIYHLGKEPGKPMLKAADAPYRQECRFRKLGGRWYNGE